MTKWLDVKKYPPQYARVLCLTTTGRVELCEVIGDYSDGQTTYYEQSNGTPITHWMHVPKSYAPKKLYNQEWRREYYKKNKEKMDAQSKIYREANREKVTVYNREYQRKRRARLKAMEYKE